MRRRKFITLLGGAAAGWPLVARAQQQRTGKIPRIGFLLNVQSELVVALFDGLRDAGYIDRQNMVVETRFAGNTLDRIGEVANELVALNCDVIFAAGPYAIQALVRATSTIPIVGNRPGKRSHCKRVGQQHKPSRRQPYWTFPRSS
jgi:putative ABC transport system substrate-binding protein